MENITFVSAKEYGEKITAIFDAKKLKTREHDFLNISSYKVIPEEKIDDTSLDIDTSNVHTPEVEEEAVSLHTMDIANIPDLSESVYGSHVEEEVDTDKIKEITTKLEDSYKGVNPSISHLSSKVDESVKEESKETKEITKEDFEKELNLDSYDTKIAAYKDGIKVKYNALCSDVNDKQREIDTITAEYTKEVDVSSKLQDEKKNLQNILNGINGIDLSFLPKDKDDLDNAVISSLTALFTDRRDKYNAVTQEVKNSDERKKNLGKEEMAARDQLKSLKGRVVSFIDEYYPRIIDANEKDAELKALYGEITEFTGIKDEPKPDKMTVFSIENLMEKQRDDNTHVSTNSNSVNVNPFNDLRANEIEQTFRRAM